MSLRINDLRNFIEIAFCRTMREGAQRLRISQPALSESIKRLEKDVGETLLYRSRSGIALTPSGQEVARKGQMAINTLNDIANDGVSEKSRLVTIGCHETVGSYFLPVAFQNLSGRKDLRFRLKHSISRNILLDVQQGRIDVGIVVNPVPSPDLVIRTVATDEICVWQSSEHTVHQPRIFCNLHLNQTHFILKKWRGRPSEIIETESLELVARMANSGSYGIAPRRLINLLGLSRLKQVPGSPTYKDTFALVHRPEFGKSEPEKFLIAELRRSFD